MSPYVVPGIERPHDPDYIYNQVCETFELTDEEKADFKNRKRHLVEARFVTMAIFKHRLKMSYKDAAGYFNKDHATGIFAVRTVKNLRETNKHFSSKTNKFFEV